MLIEYTSRRTYIKEKQQKTIASNGEKKNKNKKQNKTKQSVQPHMRMSCLIETIVAQIGD